MKRVGVGDLFLILNFDWFICVKRFPGLSEEAGWEILFRAAMTGIFMRDEVDEFIPQGVKLGVKSSSVDVWKSCAMKTIRHAKTSIVSRS